MLFAFASFFSSTPHIVIEQPTKGNGTTYGKANTAAEQVKRILIAHQQAQKKEINDLRAANNEAASTIASKQEQLASKDEQLASNKEEINRLKLLLEQSQKTAEHDKENVAEAVAAENAKHTKEIARLKLQLRQEAAADELKSQLHQQLEDAKNKDIAAKDAEIARLKLQLGSAELEIAQSAVTISTRNEEIARLKLQVLSAGAESATDNSS